MSTTNAELDRLYRDVAATGLQPLWSQTRALMPARPQPSTCPYLWRYSQVRPLLERAGSLVPVERGGERRVLACANPGLDGAPFATSTLWGALQYLGPHESAPPHRHTPAAVRFVLEGSAAVTYVDGDACLMNAGDVVLTPSWSWHDHVNESDEPMIWFDGLDMPAVIALDAVFYENHRIDEPIRRRTLGDVNAYDLGPGLLPSGHESQSPNAAWGHGSSSPIVRYRWDETDRALGRLLCGLAEPMVTIEFTNPTTGRAAMPTLGCLMHRIRPLGQTQPTRVCGSSVFVVYAGAGRSRIDGIEFAWERGDVFAVPSWARVEHESDQGADLFSVTDRPMLEALGLYRESRKESG